MSNNQLSILIVEDDLSFGLELKILLEEIGYEAQHLIDNGEEAYDFIYLHRPDLVLMDIELKGEMSGIELGQRIISFDIPIIYITSFAQDSLFKAAQASNMTAYLVKPINKYTLQSTIAYTLQAAYKKAKDQMQETENLFVKNYFFVRAAGIYKKIYIPDIYYVQSYDNYCNIYTLAQKPYTVRIPISTIENNLPANEFLRIHRKYIVQLCKIDTIDFVRNTLIIKEIEISFSRSKRSLLEQVIRRLN